MKLKPKTMVQYCLDAQYLGEVLKAVPKKVHIKSMTIRLGTRALMKRCVRPNKLMKLGVMSMRATIPANECLARFDDMTRKKMLENTKKIAEILGLNPDNAMVMRMVVEYKDTTGYFTRVTKAIHPDETDLRKKLAVMGLNSSEGNEVPLIKALSAKKYACTYERVTTTRIICAKVI